MNKILHWACALTLCVYGHIDKTRHTNIFYFPEHFEGLARDHELVLTFKNHNKELLASLETNELMPCSHKLGNALALAHLNSIIKQIIPRFLCN